MCLIFPFQRFFNTGDIPVRLVVQLVAARILTTPLTNYIYIVVCTRNLVVPGMVLMPYNKDYIVLLMLGDRGLFSGSINKCKGLP
jgi:hypothetical protein